MGVERDRRPGTRDGRRRRETVVAAMLAVAMLAVLLVVVVNLGEPGSETSEWREGETNVPAEEVDVVTE